MTSFGLNLRGSSLSTMDPRGRSGHRWESLNEKSEAAQPPAAPKKRRFTLMMIVALLIIFGSGIALLEYSNATTLSMTVAGSPHAYFEVVYGTTNATLPEAQNAVVDLPPHADVTVYAIPDPNYQVEGWNLSGAQEIGTNQNSISIETGPLGSTIDLSVNLTNSTG